MTEQDGAVVLHGGESLGDPRVQAIVIHAAAGRREYINYSVLERVKVTMRDLVMRVRGEKKHETK